ncbi:MAG: DUF1294 domain-containing protein [Oscillospiraceae bacterium]|nr:DUF1294 domain-containing protein [Oscillospiraceae bacterium]
MTIKYYAFYIGFMSAISFLIMFIDKQRARKGKRRISERMLLGIAALGGCFGGYLAMQIFHHKTRRTGFAVGLPVMMFVHLIIFILLIDSGTIPLPKV